MISGYSLFAGDSESCIIYAARGRGVYIASCVFEILSSVCMSIFSNILSSETAGPI